MRRKQARSRLYRLRLPGVIGLLSSGDIAGWSMAGQSSWASAAAAGSPLGRGSASPGSDRHRGESEAWELAVGTKSAGRGCWRTWALQVYDEGAGCRRGWREGCQGAWLVGLGSRSWRRVKYWEGQQGIYPRSKDLGKIKRNEIQNTHGKNGF